MGNAIIGRGGPADNAKVGEVRYTMRNSLGEKWALCNGDPVMGSIDDSLMSKLSNPTNPSSWNVVFQDISDMLYIFDGVDSDSNLCTFIIKKLETDYANIKIEILRISTDSDLESVKTAFIGYNTSCIMGALYLPLINNFAIIGSTGGLNPNSITIPGVLTAQFTNSGLCPTNHVNMDIINSISIIPTQDNSKCILPLLYDVDDDGYSLAFDVYDGLSSTATRFGYDTSIYTFCKTRKELIPLHYATSGSYTVGLFALWANKFLDGATNEGWFAIAIPFNNDGPILDNNGNIIHKYIKFLNSVIRNGTDHYSFDGSIIVKDNNTFIIHLCNRASANECYAYEYNVSTNTSTEMATKSNAYPEFVNLIQDNGKYYILGSSVTSGNKIWEIPSISGETLYNNMDSAVELPNIRGYWRGGAYRPNQTEYYTFDGSSVYKNSASLPLYDCDYNVFMKIKN